MPSTRHVQPRIFRWSPARGDGYTLGFATLLGIAHLCGPGCPPNAIGSEPKSRTEYRLRLWDIAVPPGEGQPLDRLVAAYWSEQNVSPAAVVGDERFARRVALDLIGIPPTSQQLAAFLADHSSDKRARWIDRLLADRENYAAHWMTFWSDLLRIGSEVNSGTFDNDNTTAPKDWLKAQLDQDVPYDRLVQGVLAGDFYEMFALSVAPREDIISVVECAEMQMATTASQVFLGIQMKCASCHDSFIDRWTLQDAWGLAVALGEKPLEIHRCQTPVGEQAQPCFPLKELGDIDAQADVHQRRRRVAELMTDSQNGLFARTIVNRLWARLFGRGIIEPLDEMMEHQPWSPETLEYLASELVRQDYDLKHILRLIANSRAYQTLPVVRSDRLKDDAYVFQGPEMRWLMAEQFVDSLHLLATAPEAENALVQLAERAWQHKGSSRLATMLGRPTRDVVVSARVQEPSALLALELINGPELDQLVQTAATASLKYETSLEAVTHRVYCALLSRAPTPKENEVASGLLSSVSDASQHPEAVGDLIWTVLMLPEYQLMP